MTIPSLRKHLFFAFSHSYHTNENSSQDDIEWLFLKLETSKKAIVPYQNN